MADSRIRSPSYSPTLYPVCKRMPGRARSDNAGELSHNDQKQAPPQRRAMNPSRGPQVICGQQEKKRIRSGIGWVHLTEKYGDVPAKESGPCEPSGCDDDEAL